MAAWISFSSTLHEDILPTIGVLTASGLAISQMMLHRASAKAKAASVSLEKTLKNGGTEGPTMAALEKSPVIKGLAEKQDKILEVLDEHGHAIHKNTLHAQSHGPPHRGWFRLRMPS